MASSNHVELFFQKVDHFAKDFTSDTDRLKTFSREVDFSLEIPLCKLRVHMT